MYTFSRLRKTSRDDGDQTKMVLAASDVTVQIFAKLIVTLKVKNNPSTSVLMTSLTSLTRNQIPFHTN